MQVDIGDSLSSTASSTCSLSVRCGLRRGRFYSVNPSDPTITPGTQKKTLDTQDSIAAFLMASQRQSQVYYDTEEKNLMRLSSIHRKVTTRVLLFVFQNGSPGRSEYSSLLDYYKAQGILNFAKGLTAVQKEKVKNDRDGESFDITLLCRCLCNGSHGLAKDYESWKAQDKEIAGIESLITIVKNKRNHLAHDDHPPITNKNLAEEAKEIQDILTRILKFSGQIYGLEPGTVEREIDEVESEIRLYLHGEFEASTFEDYKKEMLFEALSDLVNEKGVKEVLQQYDMAYESEVSTVNHLAEVKVPLKEVYTEMKLRGELPSGEEVSALYENVLCDQSSEKTNYIVVIDGVAGVGKTTLTKKVVTDWKLKEGNMKYLDTYDLLLKAECRNSAIKSFDDLLYHLMPRVSKLFKPGDLKKVVLAQRVLIVLDGLDELNKSSANLLGEILDLKTHFGITLLITTRPEKLTYLHQRVNSHNLKHIQLLGIPLERRDDFVTKYHREIAKIYSQAQDVKGLISYLKGTEHRLADLWRLPYNLSLLSILWAYDHMNVIRINTAPELYGEIFRLYRNKLKERLQVSIPADESVLRRKIDYFLHALSKESLMGLKNDQINIPQPAYKRMEEVCRNIQVPIEEMISAFLKRVPSKDVIYSFPHKGLQDFLAAWYIFLEISGEDHGHDIEEIMKAVTSCLIQNRVSPKVSNTIVETVKKELTNKHKTTRLGFRTAVNSMLQSFLSPKTRVIRNLLEDIHGSPQLELAKFENTLFCLIGLFYSEEVEIAEDVKLEALELLQATGMRDRDSWIRILNSVKCDEFIAAFISKQQKVFSGNIQMTDSSVSAYIALLKSLKRPFKEARTVRIDIAIEGELMGAHELLHLISSFQMTIKKLLITHRNYKEYTDMIRKLSSPLKDEGDIEVDIAVDEDLRNIGELLTVVKQRNLKVRRLKVHDLEVRDSNVVEYVKMLKSLPQLSPSANHNIVKINVVGDLIGADELLELLVHQHFTVRKLLINDNNFTKYTDLLGKITMSFRDKEKLEITLNVDEDLRQLTALLNLIKKNQFQVVQFKVKDFIIDDTNFPEYISALKEMPPSDQANETCIDLEITGNLIGASDLLTLINLSGFTVRRFMVTEHNFTAYTAMLEGMATTFKEASKVEMHLLIDEDISTISRLITEIKKKRLHINTFQVRDFEINDSNITLCLLILRSLSLQCRNDEKPSAKIAIKEGARISHDLLQLIRIYEINVESILITDSNIERYVNVLSHLLEPLKDASNVNIDIEVTTSLPDIQEILTWTTRHGFHLRKLNVENGKMLINTQNAKYYILPLKNLPKLEKNAYEGEVYVYIDEMTEVTDTILCELARNEFKVVLDLYHDFKNPMAPTTSTDVLNVLFEKCRVEKYVGRMSGDLRLPQTLYTLWASVPDNLAYFQLHRFLRPDRQLDALCVSVSLNLDPKKIIPLKNDLMYHLSVCFPGVISEEDVLKATEIAMKFEPTSRELDYLLFPRLNLTQDKEVICFVSNMRRLRVTEAIILPKSLKESKKFDSFTRPKPLIRSQKKLIKKDMSLNIEW
ncbi:uncharacterized protein LOC135204971 [Macrobrachium nipponense]|uniref:uncharacterized protein LOC135204971 n=1 Tax=Macrobrachium nipponense TaxID=159736 RepID=UPI0030C7D730